MKKIILITLVGLVSMPLLGQAADALQERSAVVTPKGEPSALPGPEIPDGGKAPDLEARDTGLNDIRLGDRNGSEFINRERPLTVKRSRGVIYGSLIEDLRLLSRDLFIANSTKMVRHIDYAERDRA